jgi:hypothetical protein
MAKKPFNPDNFDVDLKVKNVVEDFPQLLEFDYKKVSLNEELTKLNYEVVSPSYEDKKYSSINDYLELDVDYIV